MKVNGLCELGHFRAREPGDLVENGNSLRMVAHHCPQLRQVGLDGRGGVAIVREICLSAREQVSALTALGAPHVQQQVGQLPLHIDGGDDALGVGRGLFRQPHRGHPDGNKQGESNAQ